MEWQQSCHFAAICAQFDDGGRTPGAHPDSTD